MKPFNVGEARGQGFEVEAGIRPFDWLSVQTGYMYLDTYNKMTGEYLLGRSKHTWKTAANVMYDRWNFTARVRYFSEFGFSDANGNRLIDRTPNELAPANIQLDMRLAMRLRGGIELYGGVDNVTSSRVQVGGVAPSEGLPLYYLGMRMTM